MAIGLATPAPINNPNNVPHSGEPTPLQTATEENGPARTPHSPPTGPPVDKQPPTGDYFSSVNVPTKPAPSGPSLGEAVDDPPAEKDKEEKDSSLFALWRWSRKSRSTSTDMTHKPPIPPVDEKAPEYDSMVADKPDPLEDTLLGLLKRLKATYEVLVRERVGEPLPTCLAPSLPQETPILNPPGNTTIIVQEDRPDSGGVADLYRGTVSSLGEDADVLERVAPAWLADLILLNRIPFKEIVKVSFVLLPWQDKLPALPSESGYVCSTT